MGKQVDEAVSEIEKTYHTINTVTSNKLAGGFCFEWSSDAEASIKNHPDEWKTIAKYKWGK